MYLNIGDLTFKSGWRNFEKEEKVYKSPILIQNSLTISLSNNNSHTNKQIYKQTGHQTNNKHALKQKQDGRIPNGKH